MRFCVLLSIYYLLSLSLFCVFLALNIHNRYIYEEPRTDSLRKLTYINSSTEITITDDQLKQIASQISAMRNLIINVTESKAG